MKMKTKKQNVLSKKQHVIKVKVKRTMISQTFNKTVKPQGKVKVNEFKNKTKQDIKLRAFKQIQFNLFE